MLMMEDHLTSDCVCVSNALFVKKIHNNWIENSHALADHTTVHLKSMQTKKKNKTMSYYMRRVRYDYHPEKKLIIIL